MFASQLLKSGAAVVVSGIIVVVIKSIVMVVVGRESTKSVKFISNKIYHPTVRENTAKLEQKKTTNTPEGRIQSTVTS